MFGKDAKATALKATAAAAAAAPKQQAVHTKPHSAAPTIEAPATEALAPTDDAATGKVQRLVSCALYCDMCPSSPVDTSLTNPTLARLLQRDTDCHN